jgi:mannose-6-phosphate isomerase-like protein (cupin superfamily)
MGYTVLTPDVQSFAAPSWRPDDERQIVEIPLAANLEHSRCHLWRYPAGVKGRRHFQTVQEEVFLVVEGEVVMTLGEEREEHTLPPRSIVVLEPRTQIHIRNDGDTDALFFAYGAPSDRGAEILDD